MNYCKHLFSLLLILSSLYSLHGQTNKKTLNYQAVILDPKVIEIPGASITGQPLNKGNVCLRFSLMNAQGGVDYEETQQVTTDEYGLVNVAIGNGTQASSNTTSIYKNFESIVWNSGVKSLKVSVSFDGCNSFKQVTTQGLNYTPYSLYSEAVDYKNVIEAPKKLSQFLNDESFLIPKSLDPLKQDIQTNSTQIETANQTIKNNKQTSDAAFLVVNQSLTSVDKQVTENTRSLTTMETKLTDQQNQIVDNRNQISSTNNSMNAQIGGLQGQINTSNSTVSNLMNGAEMQSNKSTAANLGGANPSDQAYPSQRAAKAYVDQLVSQIATSGVPDATTLAAGKLQLAGDLGGTATSPTVPALANKENSSNKSTNVQTDAASDTKYPSVKAVKAYVDQATLGTALAADLANKANITSPSFTGTPTAPTPTSNDNSTKIATTAFVQAATAGIALQASLDGKADKNSPTFTGTPVLPTGTTGVTQASGDNSTKLATTAFVTSSVSAGVQDATTTASGKIQLAGDLGGSATSPTVPGLTLKAPLASPTFTGTPVLPTGTTGVTQTAGDNSTKLATTAYVAIAVSAVSGNSGVPYTGATAAVNLGSYDLTVNGLNIGKGLGAIATNTSVGNAALLGNTSGNRNTATGNQALQYNTTGSANTAFGYQALQANTTGGSNVAIGNGALYQSNSFYNIGIGESALAFNASGTSNIGIGRGPLTGNKYGSQNIGIGEGAGYNLNGYNYNSGTGGGNVFIGYYAARGPNLGSNNTAIGTQALNNNLSASNSYTYSNNVALGYGSGMNSLSNNNTFLGASSDIDYNITDYATFTNSTALGYNAKIAASNTIQLGNTSVTNVKTSGTITAGAVTYPKIDGTSGQVLTTNGSGTASWATASGGGAGVPYTGASQGVNLGGYDLKVNELTIGSGKVGTSGSISNTIVGGSYSNRTFTTVLSNTAIGYGTMSEAKPGNNNTAVGAYSLVSTTGSENSVIGAAALERNLGGSGNTAIGYYSLRNNLSGSNNTALGHNSLISNSPGEKNTMIGASADLGADNLTNATAIGYQAKVAASNTIQLGADGTNGTTAITNVKTSGTITAGAVTYPKIDGTSGQVLTTNGSGTASWATASGGGAGVPYTGASQAVNLGGYDLTVNGMTIGSGKVGSSATLNTIIGEYALNRASAYRGTDNTAIGYKTMGNETSQTTSAGTKNTAVGSWTLIYNSGQENSAMGNGALEQNQGGNQNTAMGSRALNINYSGSNNTALGYAADVASNNLSNATAIGNGAKVAASNTIQLGNTSVTNVKTSGTVTAGSITYPNTAGTNGYYLKTDGTGTASWSAVNLPTASSSTLGGIKVGTGLSMDMMNSGTMNLSTASSMNLGGIKVGTGLSMDMMNSGTMNLSTASSMNLGGIKVGTGLSMDMMNSGTMNLSTASSSTLGGIKVGTGLSMDMMNSGTMNLNTASSMNLGGIKVGTGLSMDMMNSGTMNLSTASSSTLGGIKVGAGLSIDMNGILSTSSSGVPYTGATGAVDLGAYDLKVHDLTIGTGSGNGTGNTAFGYESLNVNTAKDNTAIGYLSLRLNTTGYENTANGNFSLPNNTSGSKNTAYGTGSLQSNVIGSNNTAVGRMSLYTSVGSDNTALGYGAGYNNATGTNNTFIGRDADASVAALTNATAIGVMAKVATSNTIQLGNTSVTNVKTSGTITAGDVTYPNTHGSANQVLSTTGSGTLAWTSTGTHTIGESYGGGIVFYVYDNGRHGLIAATSDQSAGIRWYGGSYTNTRARADGVGAGLKNTAIIIANQGSVDGDAFAATVCNEYSVNETVGGITTTYGDWYLPSKHELNLLYEQKNVITNLDNTGYWSSTESDNNNAWYQYFGNPQQQNVVNKAGATVKVRAIRAF